MELGASAQIEVDKHSSLLDQFEQRKQARAIVVPTDDHEVKMTLREFLEPITLFGEGPAERRDRLKDLLTKLGPAVQRKRAVEEDDEEKEEKAKEVWYHAGPPELVTMRTEIACLFFYSAPHWFASQGWFSDATRLVATSNTLGCSL